MPQITRVGALDGDVLDIDLSNGNSILLSVKPILALPGFESLREDDRVLYPKTDGLAIYWQSGQRITLSEIIAMLGRD